MVPTTPERAAASASAAALRSPTASANSRSVSVSVSVEKRTAKARNEASVTSAEDQQGRRPGDPPRNMNPAATAPASPGADDPGQSHCPSVDERNELRRPFRHLHEQAEEQISRGRDRQGAVVILEKASAPTPPPTAPRRASALALSGPNRPPNRSLTVPPSVRAKRCIRPNEPAANPAALGPARSGRVVDCRDPSIVSSTPKHAA